MDMDIDILLTLFKHTYRKTWMDVCESFFFEKIFIDNLRETWDIYTHLLRDVIE